MEKSLDSRSHGGILNEKALQGKKILIVIPAYNEGRIIHFLVREIKSMYPHVPVLVVSDGSTDDTVQQAERAGAWVVSLAYNLGIGGAVQTAFKIAYDEGYEITVQIDGDAQHDPAYLMNVLSPVAAGELDLCIGSRFLIPGPGFRSTLMRRIGIRFFALLLGSLTGVHITDPTSGFRATGQDLIRRFAASYPIDFPEPEAIQLARRFGGRVGEAPVKMRKRLGGTSSIRYFATLYYMIKVTLAILIDTLRRPSRGKAR